MDCQKYEQKIALFVEGDLPLKGEQKLKKHLKDCVLCQTFLKELKESQALFKSLGTQALDSKHSDALRVSVMDAFKEELDKTEQTFWQTSLFFVRPAYLVLFLIFCFIFTFDFQREHYPSLIVGNEMSRSVNPSDRQDAFFTKTGHPSIDSVSKETLLETSNVSQQPALVQWITDDPKIVIYWFIDEQTGEKMGG